MDNLGRKLVGALAPGRGKGAFQVMREVAPCLTTAQVRRKLLQLSREGYVRIRRGRQRGKGYEYLFFRGSKALPSEEPLPPEWFRRLSSNPPAGFTSAAYAHRALEKKETS